MSPRVGRPTPRHEQGVIGLLAAILDDSPKLPDALCIGRPEKFDCDNGDGVAAAVSACKRCPSFGACESWADRQRGLTGVVAGRFHPTKHSSETPEKRTETK